MSTHLLREKGQNVYQALAAALRKEIHDGGFVPDRRLPTEAELVERYGVSRQTVRRALQDLVAEGLVFRIRGRGTYATQGPTDHRYIRSVGSIDDLIAFGYDTELETLEPLRLTTGIDAASRLRLPSDHVAFGLFRRVHDDVPFGVVKVYLPPNISRPLMERDRQPGATRRHTFISEVETTLGHPLSRALQSVNVARMPSELAHHIEREPGDPVLHVDRVYLDVRGTPIMLALSWFHPDRYTYRLEIRRTLGPK